MASEKPSNMGKPWLHDEIVQLLQNVKKKKTFEEIAELHQRTLGGVKSRLRGLAADYHAEGRSIDDIKKYTGLTEEEINDTLMRRKAREHSQERRKAEKNTTPKTYVQTKITSYAVTQPTMSDIMSVLHDIQEKLSVVLARSEIN